MNKIAKIQELRDNAMKMTRIHRNFIDRGIAIEASNHLLSVAISEWLAYEKVLELLTSIECPLCHKQFENRDASYINNEGVCVECDNKAQAYA